MPAPLASTHATALAQIGTQTGAPADRDWQSLHCFLHDFTRLDDFLVQCIARLPADVLQRSFFIRYWLGGPHIRFRFRGRHHRPAVEAAIGAYLGDAKLATALDPDDYYRPYRRLLATEIAIGATPPWHDHGSIVAIAYQPEFERYGGRAAMPLVEDHFVGDSRAMLAAIRLHAPARREPLLLGCCFVHREVLRELRPERPVPAATAHADDPPAIAAQHRAVEALHQQWRAGALFPEWLDPYAVRLAALGTALDDAGVDDLASVFDSLLHMSFNRAGIRPMREATIRQAANRAWH